MLRSFMQAHYSERNLGHFGLAAAEYTHFTSPIRRYPDLLVHRLLKESPGKAALSRLARDYAGAASRVCPSHFVPRAHRGRSRTGNRKNQEGAVHGRTRSGRNSKRSFFRSTRQGFFVELLEHYVEGFVPLGTLIDDEYQYKEATRSFTGKRRRSRFQLGSKVRVRLDSADMETARLSFSVVGRIAPQSAELYLSDCRLTTADCLFDAFQERLFLRGEHRAQVDQGFVFFQPENDRRILQAQPGFDRVRDSRRSIQER